MNGTGLALNSAGTERSPLIFASLEGAGPKLVEGPRGSRIFCIHNGPGKKIQHHYVTKFNLFAELVLHGVIDLLPPHSRFLCPIVFRVCYGFLNGLSSIKRLENLRQGLKDVCCESCFST